MSAFLPALDLSRRLHAEVVAPLIASRWPALRYAAVVAGEGSEVLGFDDATSTDHDWGPRLQIVLAARDFAAVGADVLEALQAGAPPSFEGWPVRFWPRGIDVLTAEAWALALGLGPQGPLAMADWLAVSEQRLAAALGGAVFRDDAGQVTALRARLAAPPPDLRLYRLACQWTRIAEERAFVGRTGSRGDDLGSRVIAARLARDVMAIGFLLDGVHAPYAKWFGAAFARLPSAAILAAPLARALAAEAWPERELALAQAALAAADLHRSRGLPGVFAPRIGPYFDRPFQVINADEIAAAIRAEIGDPALRERPLTGAIDQISDSTLVVSSPERSQAVVRSLEP